MLLKRERRKSCVTNSREKKDMTYLKAEIATSPFTSANNIDECMKAEVDEEKKNEHLYIEVMYAKMTISNMKTSSAVFCL